MKTTGMFVVLMLALGAGVTLGTQYANADPPPQCFEIEVIYEGRDFLYSEGSWNYYRWYYTVRGDTCITHALSNWILEVCDEYLPGVSEVSTLSVDQSDPAHGDSTYYAYEIGWQDRVEYFGIKWETVSGNELDTPGEYDSFSFISPGVEVDVEVKWVGKDGLLYDAGTTIGPGCFTVPVEHPSWGRLKTIYR